MQVQILPGAFYELYVIYKELLMIDWAFWGPYLIWFAFGGIVVFTIMAWIIIALMDSPLPPESYDDPNQE